MGIAARLRLLLAAGMSVLLLTACGGTPAPTLSTPPAFSPGAAAPSRTPGESPDPLPESGDVEGVHDPSLVKASDGSYRLYSTGDDLEIRTSPDRSTWTRAGSVWPDGAPWTEPFTSPTDRGALWAPDISVHGGTYYLYYAASSFGSRHSAIFLATSATGLAGSWTNQGIVVQTTESDDHNAIDPNLFVDADGSWWLVFGSFWSGIKLVALDSTTGKPETGAKLTALATRPRSVDGAIEAPYLISRDGYYYLFTAFDLCCRGTASTYRTMVGRATKLSGPYLDRDGERLTDGGGTEVVASHGLIAGPGHPAVLRDGADWVLIYHYYDDDRNPATGRLATSLLDWPDGWPVLRP
ncbi:arabinan endo-1,5-alpha-L-arabinosidase [uncultured Friedmanniella sp.]|uniref:arabinan endo-1,5-alpha-L-arabinosidase n=1 Tax=uncultured Friedmanniella sp. TaxID=335381 RepID=UPI0035C947DA